MPCLDQWRRGGVHRPTELLDVVAQVVRDLSYVLGLRGLNTPGHIRVYKGDHGVDLLDDLDQEVERVAREQPLGDAGRVVVPEREHRHIPAAQVADMPNVVPLEQAGVAIPDVDDRCEQ
jgi:hypothetical protein